MKEEIIDEWKIQVIISALDKYKRRLTDIETASLKNESYTANDYINDFRFFLASHSLSDIVDKMLETHSADGEVSLSDLFDEILETNLTEKQRKAVMLLYSPDFYEKKDKEINVSSLKTIARDGVVNITKNNGLEKMFYNKHDFDKLSSWETTSIFERYLNILDLKIIEFELPFGAVKNILEVTRKHETSVPCSLLTLGDFLEHLNEIQYIKGCGIKKQQDIKEYVLDLFKREKEWKRKDSVEREM